MERKGCFEKEHDELYDDAHKQVVQRRGGWFVTGIAWSGPWPSAAAAELAKNGKFDEARVNG
jgi:hypothetical protein